MVKYTVVSFLGEIALEKSFDSIIEVVSIVNLNSFEELMKFTEIELKSIDNLIFKIVEKIINLDVNEKGKLNFEQKKVLNSFKSFLIELYTLAQIRKDLKLKIEVY